MARATLCHTLATSLVKGDYTSMEVELREQMQQYVAVCGMKRVRHCVEDSVEFKSEPFIDGSAKWSGIYNQ